MLENEPNNGADGTAGTTETTETTDTGPVTRVAGDPQASEVTVSAPGERSGVRRPAGPPPEPEPLAEGTDGPLTTLAGPGDTETVVVEAAESTGSVASVQPTEPEPEAKAQPKRARTAGTTRARARAAVEPEQAEPEPGTEEDAEAVADPTSVSFQPPMVLFQPPIASAGPAPQEPTNGTGPAAVEDTADTTAEQGLAEADTGAEDEYDDERPSRRRRRRGGRGRGRSRTGEEDTESEPVADQSVAEEDENGDENSGESARTETEHTEIGTSRRRRRRRRRSAGGGDEALDQDDPPNTVVRVREPRSDKPIEDEVQAVKGSTRLEAKKQRRREGREQGRRRAPVITESEFLARRESVKRDLVIRRIGERTQIAVLEDDVLVEHYVDRVAHRSYVGNVYLGRVQNVLPSMEAAFVDIGKGRNAVLYAGEVNWDASGLEGQPKRIESVLKSGQSVLVQVTKDPLGHKGARLTSQISLPGRYLVYVPDGSMTGISRKLPDKERARLKQILKKVMPENAGVIVRTAAEGASEEELERDISRLASQWDSIKRKAKSASAPSLLNSEPDLTVRVVRDVFNEDFSSLVVSGGEAWDTVREYVDYVAPHLAERLSHWTEERDVFEAYRVDEQIAKALERKVWLPSGGSLIIDRTEAMTVVDVNTGKFTGQGGNLEETVTKNNLEAAEEIVRQLRLRDIGGIIVIDFIDMVLESNRDLVLRRMLECLSRDRTKHQVAEVTSLGLVQMTRKRVGQGLLEAFSHSCEHCNGRGLVVSTEPVEAKGGSGNGNGNGRKKKGKGGQEKPSEGEKAEQRRAEPAAEPSAEEPAVAGAAADGEQAKPAEPAPEAVPEEPAKTPARSRKTTAKKTFGKGKAKKEESAAETGDAGGVAAEEETASAAGTAGDAATDTAVDTAGDDMGGAGGAGGAAAEEETASAADPAGEQRPRRRRTRRTKTTGASPESAVAEAG